MSTIQSSHEAVADAREGGWDYFDMHGRVSMRVAQDAPTAAQLKDMFYCFRGAGHGEPAPHEVVVTPDLEAVAEAADLETALTYTDDSVTIPDARMQVIADAGGYRVHGRGELLTTVVPLVDALMVRTGAAMYHAAAIDFRGRGVAMPAAGGTGKTSTIAKFMRMDGVGFMGDDWGFVSADGRMLGFAKPMFIKPHHRAIYPHLFEGARKPLVPVALSRPVGRFTTMVHPVVARYPKAAALARRWSPEHRMVHADAALPGGRVSTAAPLALTVYLERYAGERTRLERRSVDWMVARMLGNFHIELPGHSQQLVTALGATGVLPLERYFGDKAAVVRAALEGVPTFVLQVPRHLTPDEASDQVVSHVLSVLGETS